MLSSTPVSSVLPRMWRDEMGLRMWRDEMGLDWTAAECRLATYMYAVSARRVQSCYLYASSLCALWLWLKGMISRVVDDVVPGCAGSGTSGSPRLPVRAEPHERL